MADTYAKRQDISFAVPWRREGSKTLYEKIYNRGESVLRGWWSRKTVSDVIRRTSLTCTRYFVQTLIRVRMWRTSGWVSLCDWICAGYHDDHVLHRAMVRDVLSFASLQNKCGTCSLLDKMTLSRKDVFLLSSGGLFAARPGRTPGVEKQESHGDAWT